MTITKFSASVFAAALMILMISPRFAAAQNYLPKDSLTATALKQDANANTLFSPVEKLEASYAKSQDKKTKASLVEAYMKFGKYLMFDAPVSPRLKYRPALRAFNRVLALDKSNEEAATNKKQIEDIYTQMGQPIPKD